MEALKKKLGSRRGASILLALLFLLVCMMVGASVLMAAASNAGKIKSNGDEQQRYLTLSSALTLTCDELAGIEYRGKYKYERIEKQVTETYPDGETYTWSYYEHTYTWANDPVTWELKEVIPLYNDLDIIFAKNFQLPASKKIPLDRYYFKLGAADGKQNQTPKRKYSLTVTAEGDAAVDSEGLKEPVKIEIELCEDGGLLITAALKEHPEYIMEAFLSVSGKPEKLLVLDSHAADGTYETEPVKWTLEYIVRKDMEEGAGG